VIQTGFIAAVAIGFARFAGVLWPAISEENYLLSPFFLTPGYAVSLSTAQLVGVLMIAILTATNICGLRYGKIVQNLFTVAKTGALLGLIGVGLVLGWNSEVVAANFGDLWTPRGELTDLGGGLTAATAFGLFVALCVAQTGSLFSADTWNNVTFTAGEVRQPRRNLPLSLFLGTSAVIVLYLMANLAYLVTLPFPEIQEIQKTQNGRVATVMLARIFPTFGVPVMAAAIMISTFGCNNGLILSGARAYYAMARDGLFFSRVGRLNAVRVPAWGLVLQSLWAALLVLPRTYNIDKNEYGNLYSDLLDYIISAALLFYVLTIAAVYRLRATRPHAERPYRAFGYPLVPALYLVGAAIIVAVLIAYRPKTTWPGMALVLLGVPVYFVWKRRRG
jgi:APA family basic amino acid/polyamine antiporter